MRGIQNWEDELKPERANRNHGYVISDLQIDAIERCLEDIETRSVSLWPTRSKRGPRSSDHAPLQTIYMFYRAYPEPVRIYIGQSFFGRDRITGQIKNRKWATHVTSLEFRGYLYPGTLRLLETCVLRKGVKAFPGALWHNEQGLVVRSPDTLVRMPFYLSLDALALKILTIFGAELPDAAFHSVPEYPVTHLIGGSTEEYFGRLSHRKRCVFLLKGSRMSSRATNMTALRHFGGTGFKYGSRLYREGQMERKRGTLTRPAGLTITEPVKFADKEEAARFLTLDGPSLIWEKA